MASSSEPAVPKLRPLHEYFTTGNFVKILVGPERKQWILNEELLCDKIEYFKAAFQSGFKESQKKQLEFPEDNPEMFQRFVEWLYTGTVICRVCRGLDSKDYELLSSDLQAKHDLASFGLWVFADKIGAAKLASQVILKCKSCLGGNDFTITPEGIKFVYSHTTERSPLRDLVVNVTVQRFYRYEIGKDGGILARLIAANEEFGTETMRRISKHLGSGHDKCRIYDCCIHGSNLRKRAGEGDLGELPEMRGYDGDDVECL